jgi:hypothetical protein
MYRLLYSATFRFSVFKVIGGPNGFGNVTLMTAVCVYSQQAVDRIESIVWEDGNEMINPRTRPHAFLP